jgi:hypothetical protein
LDGADDTAGRAFPPGEAGRGPRRADSSGRVGVGNGGMGRGGGPRVRSTPLMSVRSECGDGAGSSVLTAPFPSWTAKTVAPVKVSGEA